MMTSPIQLVEKIDDFAVNDSISEIAFLAKGLLQLQHARYPHLVPMYRTVHRKIPRQMVFRAIRWVNPKRMFPGAGLTEEEMKNMSSDELEKLVVKLNDYRGEAHVIHNRYNEMLDMIQMGELPYYIPYAGFKQDKWTMLQEYKDRALRLKEGTEDWEDVLDIQAAAIKNILLNRDGDDKRKFDDIDGLWQDAKGNPAAPNFYNPKKGKEKKQFLRVMRHGKLINPPKVYARRYIAVPTAEIRKGEEVRMPAGGQVRRPRNRRERIIFDKFGGAADHLLRMPRGPFLGSDRRLRERGNLISMPAGRENPLIVTFSEISADDVANRREARWTHTDPLGARGRAPHRGGASRGAQGSLWPVEGPIPHSEERSDPSSLRAREERIRQQQTTAGTPSARQAEQETVQQQAKIVNEHFTNAAANLFKQYDIDTSNLDAMKSITDADVAAIEPFGKGVNRAQTLKITLHDGRKFMYKIVDGEQKSEQLASILDKVLDLNTQVDAVIHSNISIDAIRDHLANILDAKGNPAGIKVSNKVLNALERGGGHLQEWCEPECVPWDAVDMPIDTGELPVGGRASHELVSDDNFRESYIKMALLDFVGGNWDRHVQNFMVSADGKLQGIDNGFFGGYAEVHDGDGVSNIGDKNWKHASMFGGSHTIKPGLFAKTDGRRQDRHAPLQNARQKANIDSSQIRSEAEAIFDRHFDEDKINTIQQEIGLTNQRQGQSFEQIKKDYVAYIDSIL